jgi:hypothetical protein
MDFQAFTRGWGVNSGRSEDLGSGRDRWGADHARSGRLYAPRLPGKDGKEHRDFSLGENKRVSGARVLQRHVLYLAEINSSQELAWRKSIEVLEDGGRAARDWESLRGRLQRHQSVCVFFLRGIRMYHDRAMLENAKAMPRVAATVLSMS